MPKIGDTVTYTTWEYGAPEDKATYTAHVTHVYTDKPNQVDLEILGGYARLPVLVRYSVPFSAVARPGHWTKEYKPGKPAWQHDCKECVYLTTRVHGNDLLDFYYCNQGGNIPTMLARWGDKGWAYYSGIPYVAPMLDHSTPYEKE